MSVGKLLLITWSTGISAWRCGLHPQWHLFTGDLQRPNYQFIA